MGIFDLVKNAKARKQAKQERQSLSRTDLELAKAEVRKMQAERGLKGGDKTPRPRGKRQAPTRDRRKEIITGEKSKKAPAIVGLYRKGRRR